jgi:hypothetical protein
LSLLTCEVPINRDFLQRQRLQMPDQIRIASSVVQAKMGARARNQYRYGQQKLPMTGLQHAKARPCSCYRVQSNTVSVRPPKPPARAGLRRSTHEAKNAGESGQTLMGFQSDAATAALQIQCQLAPHVIPWARSPLPLFTGQFYN